MGNEPKFAYYWFLATDLTGFNSGSVQPMLNRNYIANIPIAVPPLDEQRGIAATLSALDDKIESNRRARSKIRALGLSLLARAQADGCDNKRLSDITLSIARGITPKYANDDHEAPWVINQKCVRDNWVSTSLARRMVDRPVADTRRASSGDILVNSTGTGTLGRVGRWHKGNVYVDSHVTIVKGDPVKVGPTTLAFLMFVREKDIEGMATGSTGQTELSATRLGELKLPVPRQNAEKLESTLQKFEDWAAALTAEEASLHKLRDTLLPELVSGRIRVPEATEAVK